MIIRFKNTTIAVNWIRSPRPSLIKAVLSYFKNLISVVPGSWQEKINGKMVTIKSKRITIWKIKLIVDKVSK